MLRYQPWNGGNDRGCIPDYAVARAAAEHIEFLRYRDDSQVPAPVRYNPHVAYRVTDLKPHLEAAGVEILIPPFVVGDFVEVDTAESPFELASENLRRENVRRALDALPPREREVIEMRYGLTGHKSRTLEEVGRAFGVTRERIRQIENQSLKKLQSLAEAQKLRDVA